MHPLVRWQFRGGIDAEDRKAFLFTNVTDSKGREFDIPVLVCGLAANSRVYEMGMGVPVAEIKENWIRAMNAPIAPNVVDDAPCHEIVYRDNELLNGNGLDALPVPISSPGWDNAPLHHLVPFHHQGPRDRRPEHGQLPGDAEGAQPDRHEPVDRAPDGRIHALGGVEEARRADALRHRPGMPATSSPSPPSRRCRRSSTSSGSRAGLVGKPLNVVRAKTVDLLVPAEAEVVIEGYVSTELLEPEAPFGESHGHVNLQEYNGYVDVTAITRRRNAVITSWVSQVTPSESSAIKRPAYEAAQIEHLRDHLGIKGVRHVATHRAADIAPQADRRRRRPRDAAHRDLARALRCRLAPPRRGQVGDRGQRGYRPRRHQRGLLGDVLPVQAASRRRDPQAQGRGARAAQLDRQRGQRGAGGRDAEGDLPAGLAAQAAIHGSGGRDLERARPAEAQARAALVRLRSGRVERGPGNDGAARGSQRILGDRTDHRPAPPRRRFDEHRGPHPRRGKSRGERFGKR